jgi:lysophospholipase L1-like esterase
MTTLRVCFVGDSITTGTGDDDFLGWPGRLCAAERRRGHDLSLYNLGIRGDTSEMIAARWRAECAARLPAIHPAALVFAFGINDTAREADGNLRVAHDKSVATARTILAEAKAWKPTLMIGPTPVCTDVLTMTSSPGVVREVRDDRIAATSVAYADVARALGVPYLDLFTPLSADPRWRKALAEGDSLHPAASGYALMADLIGKWPAWRKWMDS